jgi:G3E family GTPase
MAGVDSGTGRVPVTVLCGPLGAGKTTLVNRLLREPGDRRIAVVVNDLGELNVDAELLRGETADRDGNGDGDEDSDGDGVIDLSNGCICCRLQDDLVSQATRLARERSFDYLVVEASGIAEPIPIARALTGAAGGDDGDGAGVDPTGVLRLDTTVTVVDAYGFWKAFDPGASLPAAAPEPERPLAEVMVDQIEFCDVLLLNKCDAVPDDELDAVEAAVRELQPRATLHRTTHCDVATDTVLGTARFDFDRARAAPGWKRALAGGTDPGGSHHDGEASAEVDAAHDHGHGHAQGHDHDDGEPSAAERHGVDSFVYERSRPFHPGRFDAWLDDWDGDVVRAKGFCWVASRPTDVLGLSRAGPAVQVGPIGEWGDDEPATRLVLIGYDLDEDRIAAALDGCLATAEERAAGVDAAADPFPRES